MHIERFDAARDPRRLRACFDIESAAVRCDDPDGPPASYSAFVAAWTVGFDDSPQESWIATGDSGEPAGCYLLVLPQRENTAMAYYFPAVPPDRRRAGIGTALLAHAAGRAQEAGRSRLTSWVLDGTPGAAFAAAAGATGGNEQVRRMLDIDASLPARLAALRTAAEPHAAGYDLLSWAGPTPEQYLVGLAETHAAMADAPRDEGYEAHHWDADRIRSLEQVLFDQNLRQYTVVARHTDSGELAALTQVATDPELPEWGFQQTTAVRSAHRGHRLGLLIKIAMLDLLAGHEPGLRRVLTGNAGANEHMIAINEQLGFQVRGTSRLCGLDVPAAVPGDAARP
jgi:GNAT superfamily N-acetyltransferase/RimJ/RimL family protein N-acetyltransferase